MLEVSVTGKEHSKGILQIAGKLALRFVELGQKDPPSANRNFTPSLRVRTLHNIWVLVRLSSSK